MENLIVLVVLSAIIAILMAAYLNLAKKLNYERGQEDKINEKARLKQEKILEEAREKALQILREAKMLSDEQRDEFEEQWKNVIKKVSRDFESGAEDEVKGFRKSLEVEAVGVEKAVADRVEQEFATAKQQIDEYKKYRLAKLDGEIDEIVSNTVKKVIGKVIPMEEHKKLIISALEEAKREHIL